MTTSLILPNRSTIQRVDHSDPLDWYYSPATGWLFRRRLQLALNLLGDGPFDNVLEAGYGSGILLPTLARRTQRLHAMDLHRRTDLAGSMLAAEGVNAALSVGTVTSLGYASGSFDALVCVSTLEHLHGEELTAAVREFKRVLRPGGTAVIGVPASGWVMDLLFRVIGFSEIGEHHVSTRGDIAGALRQTFRVDGERHLPGIGPKDAALYSVFRCRA